MKPLYYNLLLESPCLFVFLWLFTKSIGAIAFDVLFIKVAFGIVCLVFEGDTRERVIPDWTQNMSLTSLVSNNVIFPLHRGSYDVCGILNSDKNSTQVTIKRWGSKVGGSHFLDCFLPPSLHWRRQSTESSVITIYGPPPQSTIALPPKIQNQINLAFKSPPACS